MANKHRTPTPASVEDGNTWNLEAQEKELDRLLDWIKAVDAKVPVLMAISTGMIAAIAAVAPQGCNLTAWGVVRIGVGSAPAILSLVYCALATFPQTRGPEGSLIFFGTIAAHSVESYRDAVSRRSLGEYSTDLTMQCYRNAQIAALKYRRVRAANAYLFGALGPWLFAVYSLYKEN